ncbi:hypothetical protein ACIPIC_02740 [Streptomyces collinus]|uniref:hypothetical protein n=1 Tax=Streptomyces collinus TaxID=42684 RepID=UPI00382EDC46
MSQPTPNTPEAPQEATGGRQSAPEGPSGQRETLRGQNGPQRGAQGLDGEQEPRGPVDWARQQADQRATARVLAALHRSAETDVTRVIELAEQWATRPERADALRELTDALGYRTTAHNAGPSVAECAQADRRWPLEKHGE